MMEEKRREQRRENNWRKGESEVKVKKNKRKE